MSVWTIEIIIFSYFLILFILSFYSIFKYLMNKDFASVEPCNWERAWIYLQGEISGSFGVFVWHIRQTLDPTEIRLRVSRCCCPTIPGDTCCVSRPFKLQDEPSGAVVVAAGIGMLRSWSKFTAKPERWAHTRQCICMIHHVYARYLHSENRTAPHRAGRLEASIFNIEPIGNLITR